MKIAHVIESAGGSAEFVLYILKYQPNNYHYVVAGERAYDFFIQAKKENRVPANVEVIQWNASKDVHPVKDLKAFFQLKSILSKVKAEAIHCTSSKAGMLVRMACFMGKTKRVFYSPQGAPFLRLDVSTKKRKLFLWFEKIAHSFSGNIVGCSRSEALAYIENGMAASYINNGTEIFESSDFQNTTNIITIATVGRITNQKNPELFNEVALLFADRPEIKFVWIGGGELEHLITAPNIEITGWKSRLEIDEMVKKIDIYISTALWEGLPFAVLEAMNLKKPLLLYPCVGNVDLIKNQENGHLFETAEEAKNYIEQFLVDTSILQHTGNQSLIYCKESFDIRKQVEKYEQLYAGTYKGDAV